MRGISTHTKVVLMVVEKVVHLVCALADDSVVTMVEKMAEVMDDLWAVKMAVLKAVLWVEMMGNWLVVYLVSTRVVMMVPEKEPSMDGQWAVLLDSGLDVTLVDDLADDLVGQWDRQQYVKPTKRQLTSKKIQIVFFYSRSSPISFSWPCFLHKKRRKEE